jgi:uncharacterized RDD family membrane protein YckC
MSVIEKKMQDARSKLPSPAQSNAPSQRMDSLLKFQFEQDFSVYPDASLQDRLFAYAIDISVSGPLSLLVVSVFEFVVTRFFNLPHLASMLGVAVLSLIVPFLYWILMTWKVGMTVGKRIIGIQVVPRNFPNAKLGPFSVFFRETLGRSLLFPLFPLALFGFFATDFVGGTRVVRVRNPDAEV